MPPISSVKTADGEGTMEPPHPLMALTLRETKGNSGDHRPPGQKKSFLRSPTSAIHGPRAANERRSRLYNGTARNQSISIAVSAVLCCRQEGIQQEEANAVSPSAPIVVPMRHEVEWPGASSKLETVTLHLPSLLQRPIA